MSESTCPQCQEILPNSRQQCTRVGYATIKFPDREQPLAYCRLHYSFRLANKEEFYFDHEVCDRLEEDNHAKLMEFFAQVHNNKDNKEPKEPSEVTTQPSVELQPEN